jgi:hypothetical protein
MTVSGSEGERTGDVGTVETGTQRRTLMIRLRIVLTLAVLTCVGAALEIHAQDVFICNISRLWLSLTTVTGPASAPVSDPGFTLVGGSTSYFAQGHSVVAVRNVADGSFSAGSIKWTWDTPTLFDVPDSPKPVRLTLGLFTTEVLFVGAADGFLYKLDAHTGTAMGSVDTRRRLGGALVCTTAPFDALNGTPAVQLYDASDAAFKAAVDSVAGHAGDSRIFVITQNGCRDTTRNRVLAYWASDMTPAWTFPADGATKVDAGIAGCTIDYPTNTLYCGTALGAAAAGQSSLFAIDTRNGGLRWSANAGATASKITLHNGRLYVATSHGMLQAYDPAGDGFGGPAQLWTIAVASAGAAVLRNLWPFGDSLLVLDTGGSLRRVRDLGSSGTIVWESNAAPGILFVTSPVAVESLGKGYIGREDGLVQEIDLATGQGGKAVVVSAGDVVFDPSLDVEGSASDFNRLTVVSSDNVARFSIPFCPPTATPPSVTINQASGQIDPTIGSPILFSVQFSEPVTGFTSGDVDLSASTAGGALIASVSGAAATYTVAVTGMTATGSVVASIPAGAAIDSAGTPSLTSTSTDNSVQFIVPVPAADAGADQIVTATSASGAPIVLNGSESRDPIGGTDLTYQWQGPFGTASGVSATVMVPIGTFVVTLTVTSNAFGTTDTDTVQITVHDVPPPPLHYVFEGFLSPLNNVPMTNRGPAGRTYPVKWILRDGSGALVSDPAAISGVAVVPGSCGGLATNVTGEETTSIGGLTYDPLTGRWQFNWKTLRSQGGCWSLEVRLADGSVHAVAFELR